MKLFLIALLAVGARAACPGTYTAQRTITVNSSQITGTLSNYPMLVLNPSASLKTVGNGGVVTDANGYDITFYNAGGSLLPFELVGHGTGNTTYAAASGNAEFHVNVSSIADGTVVYLCYGNAAITTYQGDDAGTWSSYVGVFHFPGGAVTDSTGVNSASNNGTTSTTGQIGTGIALSGTAQYVNVGNAAAVQLVGAMSVEAWVNTTNRTNFNGIVAKTTVSGEPASWDFWLAASTGVPAFIRGNGVSDTAVIASNPVPNATWTYVAATDTSGAGTGTHYLDGAANGTAALITAAADAGDDVFIGTRTGFGTMFTGKMDEVRISSVSRSADWITACFNNQSAPGSFYAVGAETSPSAGTFTISPIALPVSNAADIVVSLTGSGTSWDGTTVITATGVSGTSCGSVNVTSATAATIICTTGATSGTLTLTESVTGSAVATVPVSSGGGTHAFVSGG